MDKIRFDEKLSYSYGNRKSGPGHDTGTTSTDFLTIEMRKDAHPMIGVIKAEFRNNRKLIHTMGTGSLFRYKLLDDWEGELKRAGEKAREYNEKFSPVFKDI